MHILRLPEVSQATGLSRSTIYRLVQTGNLCTARIIGIRQILTPGCSTIAELQRMLMTENLSPNLDIAHQFLRLITCKWSEVGNDLSMELRALGSRSQSLRFNPEKEEEVAAILEPAVQLNASGSNIHVTVNPAGPFTPDCKTRALKTLTLSCNSIAL